MKADRIRAGLEQCHPSDHAQRDQTDRRHCGDNAEKAEIAKRTRRCAHFAPPTPFRTTLLTAAPQPVCPSAAIQTSFAPEMGSREPGATCRSHKIKAPLSTTSTLLEYTDAPELRSLSCPTLADLPASCPGRSTSLNTKEKAASKPPFRTGIYRHRERFKVSKQRNPGDYAERYKTDRNNSGNHTSHADITKRTRCRAHPAPPPKSCSVPNPVSLARPVPSSRRT